MEGIPAIWFHLKCRQRKGETVELSYPFRRRGCRLPDIQCPFLQTVEVAQCSSKFLDCSSANRHHEVQFLVAILQALLVYESLAAWCPRSLNVSLYWRFSSRKFGQFSSV